jgi:zinc transport system permease protein
VVEFLADLKQYTFLQHALLTGILASIACGIIGSYVVTRRITYIAGGIAHSVLAGMGAARYYETIYQWQWLHPLYGAVVGAIIAAIIIGLVSLHAKQREDTVISAVWAIGMAIGILFIFKTPGYNQDLMSYLFGNILMISSGDLWLLAFLDLLVVGIGLLFYNKLVAICFDEEFARLRGIHVDFYYILLLCLTALTVVLLVTVVGIVLVIALLTLPSAMAGHFSKRLWQMMAFSTLFTLILTTGGLTLSYGPNLPPGATTIVLAGIAYLAIIIGSRFVKLRHR